MTTRIVGAKWTAAAVVLVSAVLCAGAWARVRDEVGAKPPADGMTYLVQVPGAG